jgi:hypothetical protein
MIRSNPLPVLASAALVGASLATQTQLPLPHHADVVEGHHSLAQPFGTPGFRTQILVDAQSIAPNGALLNSVAFRRDRPGSAIAPQRIPNVTVALSHTSVFVNGMSSTFAANVTGTPTVVFQGTVNLPGATMGLTPGPQPWDIVIPFASPFAFTTGAGNLLIDITASNPPGGQPTHWLDAVQGGGATSSFGASGVDPFDNLYLGGHAGSCTTRELSPGHTIVFTSSLMVTTRAGLLAVGTSPQPVPIDLTPFGAPTNFLYVDPIVLSPHAWTLGWFSWYSQFPVPVPNTASLVGTTLYGQSMIFEPAANPLGLVLSHAVELRLGDANEQLPLQQLNAADPAALAGTLVDWSFTATPDYGSVPIRFDGTYF